MPSRDELPSGSTLDGDYRIERVLGRGGFGITYLATDIRLDAVCAIKEFYPSELSQRDATYKVSPRTEKNVLTFEWARDRFLREARAVAQINHKNVLQVSRLFEANGTAYMVSEFLDGISVESWLRGIERKPTQAELDSLSDAILSALSSVHKALYLHRDVKPDNILIRKESGEPVLIDFGSSRALLAKHQERTTFAVVSAHYSPMEFYTANSSGQGPWSDVYSFAALLYRAVVGDPPLDPVARSVQENDDVDSALLKFEREFRPEFLQSIAWGLKLRGADRPQSIDEWRPLLLAGGYFEPQKWSEAPAALPPSAVPGSIGESLTSAKEWLAARVSRPNPKAKRSDEPGSANRHRPAGGILRGDVPPPQYDYPGSEVRPSISVQSVEYAARVDQLKHPTAIFEVERPAPGEDPVDPGRPRTAIIGETSGQSRVPPPPPPPPRHPSPHPGRREHTFVTAFLHPGEKVKVEVDRWIAPNDSTNIVFEKTTDTDVFLSYHHEDRDLVENLANSMMAQGWRVFWDRTILPGDRWEQVIENSIEAAKCVVVVWSPKSVKSDWVREEAAFGKERNNLVPVLLQRVAPPFGFKTIHASDLSGWDGSLTSREFQMFLAGVRRRVQSKPASTTPESEG